MTANELTSIAKALEQLVATQQKGPLYYIQIVGVLLTLGILIWYTIETYKLRKAGQDHTAETAKLLREAQRQNEMSVMPILAVAVEPMMSPTAAARIMLLNVGSGPAFNLAIDRLDWGDRRLQIEYGSGVLRPGQAIELIFHFLERNSGSLLDAKVLCKWIDSHRMPNPVDIVVRCNSVHSLGYAFMFRCTSDSGKLGITYAGTASGGGVLRG